MSLALKISIDNKQGLMNRQKKIVKLQKNKLRNAEKRLQESKKDKYVSKSERARLALEADNTTQNKDNLKNSVRLD